MVNNLTLFHLCAFSIIIFYSFILLFFLCIQKTHVKMSSYLVLLRKSYTRVFLGIVVQLAEPSCMVSTQIEIVTKNNERQGIELSSR